MENLKKNDKEEHLNKGKDHIMQILEIIMSAIVYHVENELYFKYLSLFLHHNSCVEVKQELFYRHWLSSI